MTKTISPMSVEDVGATTFGPKDGCRLSRSTIVTLCLAFIVFLLTIILLVYHFSPCHDSKIGIYNGNGSFTRRSLNIAKFNLDVRLPTSIVPDRYELKLVPFIWEGNFTFDGEVTSIFIISQF